MQERTPYQDRIVKNYYKNRQGLALQKLQEFVTELYLAESDKKRDQLWTRIEKAMANLGVPKKIAQHLLEKRKPELLAEHIQNWWERMPGEK